MRRVSQHILRNLSFNDDRIQPFPIEFPMLFVYSYFTKSAALAQITACKVEQEYSRNEFPISNSASFFNERYHQPLADSSVPEGFLDVNGKFANAGIARPRTVGRNGSPAYDGLVRAKRHFILPTSHGHQDGVTFVMLYYPFAEV